jgi:hypothetical protein
MFGIQPNISAIVNRASWHSILWIDGPTRHRRLDRECSWWPNCTRSVNPRNTPTRLVNKDAHDLDRILRADSTDELVAAFERLLHNDGSRQTTEQALVFLERLFTTGPEPLGSAKAGQAEEGIGDPALVSASASYLATDVVQAVRRRIR